MVGNFRDLKKTKKKQFKFSDAKKKVAKKLIDSV